MPGQERENKTGDLVVLLVQGKMTGVELVDFRIRHVALERFPTGSDERGIVAPPDHQRRRLVLTLPCLPRRVRGDVCPVVVEESGLDFALAGSRQVGVLVRPGVRIITLGTRRAEGVPLFGR